MRILITGSCGLIGSALGVSLQEIGIEIVPFDRRLQDGVGIPLDTRSADQLVKAASHCDGIIHLAAVSRVAWGERDPDLCASVNVGGTKTLYQLASSIRPRPFVIFASSREVYGHPEYIPVNEDAALQPCNIYGQTKADGENLTRELAESGTQTAIVRFSNVYGSVDDHADRVVPCFAREAATNGSVRVDGPQCVFDFTHIEDVTRGMVQLVEMMMSGERPPPIHFVSGIGTSLGQLAELGRHLSGGKLSIVENQARNFDVSRFIGDGTRADTILGWHPRTSLEAGFSRLVQAFKEHRPRDSHV